MRLKEKHVSLCFPGHSETLSINKEDCFTALMDNFTLVQSHLLTGKFGDSYVQCKLLIVVLK